jgi:hypothetical protein
VVPVTRYHQDWRCDHSLAAALLTAGTAFGGALTLIILVIQLLRR